MTQQIYGVDSDQPLTPLMVRDAIVKCFTEAHCLKSEIAPTDKEISEKYCREIVRKVFADSGGNFDQPTKDDIIGAMNGLARFSENFRDMATIGKHYQEIMVLVDKLQ